MSLWCTKHLTVRVSAPDGSRQVIVRQPFARVGSHPECDIVLPGIERRSLYLHATNAGVFCLDLGAHTKFPVAASSRWLKPDQPVTVGPYTLAAELDADAVASG